jgi:cytochrome c-type biogenesis protein
MPTFEEILDYGTGGPMITLDVLENTLKAGSILAYPAAFAGGVLASLTPCTYPLIPVTVAFIGSRSATTRKQAFLLSTAYAAGIAVVYAVLGGIAALSGRIFGLVSSHPLINFFVGVILLVLALSMVDVITLPLPTFQSSIKSEKRGGLIGALSFGICSGLVIGPCTTPVLGSLLLYVASRQNVLFGMSLLFVFACGMSTLLLCIGTVSGMAARLPKSGPWLVEIKRGLAILMACAGVYFIYQAGSQYF